MPMVSVLMPCYNASRTINEALESINRQTLSDIEIIAVDDGSDDNTLEILNNWTDREDRLKIISNQHSGIVDALNTGLTACESKYVARMDSDDRSHPDRLQQQAEYLDSHLEIGVVSCKVKGFPQTHVRRGFELYMNWLNELQTNEQIRREIFIESPLPHPSVTFRRDQIIKAGGYLDNGWAEDYDLWLRLYLSGAGFAKIPQYLLEWREHPSRLTRTDSRYSLENFLRAKAYYLACGPLQGRDGVIIWGAGMIGRRLSKHLVRAGMPLCAFVDIDMKKIGKMLRGIPIIDCDSLPEWLRRYQNPVVISAVGARDARGHIRKYLNDLGLIEGVNWWCAA